MGKLKEKIMEMLYIAEPPLSVETLTKVIGTFAQEHNNIRGTADLFVASLRAIGSQDIERAVSFGEDFIPFIFCFYA